MNKIFENDNVLKVILKFLILTTFDIMVKSTQILI